MRHFEIMAGILLCLFIMSGISLETRASTVYGIDLWADIGGLKGILLNNSTVYMPRNSKTKIAVTRFGYNGKKYTNKKVKANNVKWSSSRKKVATVSKNGTIKTKKAGKAVITAKYKFKRRTYVTRFTVKVVKSFSKGMNCNHLWNKEYKTITEMVEQGEYDEWVGTDSPLSFCHCGLIFENHEDYINHYFAFAFKANGIDPETTDPITPLSAEEFTFQFSWMKYRYDHQHSYAPDFTFWQAMSQSSLAQQKFNPTKLFCDRCGRIFDINDEKRMGDHIGLHANGLSFVIVPPDIYACRCGYLFYNKADCEAHIAKMAGTQAFPKSNELYYVSREFNYMVVHECVRVSFGKSVHHQNGQLPVEKDKWTGRYVCSECGEYKKKKK